MVAAPFGCHVLRGDTFSHFLDMDAVDPMFKPVEKPAAKPGTSMLRG